MEHRDLFAFPDERAAWRARAVQAVDDGGRKRHVARRFGISRQTLHTWMTRHRLGGPEALADRPRGRGRRRVLEPWQEAQVAHAIRTLPPRTVQARGTRWTKKAVSAYVERQFGVRFTTWQVDRHLHRWGFASHKELRRAFLSNTTNDNGGTRA